MDNYNLFGEKIESDPILRDRFIEPPFSVLDTKNGNWQNRKRAWAAKGIKSEIGRSAKTFNMNGNIGGTLSDTSIFDPALCEVMYKWFCPDGGRILDPFAGGSVRGIVANFLGYSYTGVDIRTEQVESNYEQSREIFGVSGQPNWIVGDSNEVVSGIVGDFDMVFSCPPYADLEVYSDLPGDISNKSYDEFLRLYRSIIEKSVGKLKDGGFAVFVVGEVRDKSGYYVGFVPDTVKAFVDAGAGFYNDAILLNAIGTAAMRANGNMKSKKLVKVHQNILVFRK